MKPALRADAGFFAQLWCDFYKWEPKETARECVKPLFSLTEHVLFPVPVHEKPELTHLTTLYPHDFKIDI